MSARAMLLMLFLGAAAAAVNAEDADSTAVSLERKLRAPAKHNVKSPFTIRYKGTRNKNGKMIANTQDPAHCHMPRQAGVSADSKQCRCIDSVCQGAGYNGMDMKRGHTVVLELSLDRSIICDQNQKTQCNVQVLAHNGAESKLSLSTCQLTWLAGQEEEKRELVIQINEDSQKHFNDILTKVSFEIKSNALFYDVATHKDNTHFKMIQDVLISLRANSYLSSGSPASCSGSGDPHMHGFDHEYYHYYGHGTQVLYKTKERDFEVQSRTHRWHSASVFCGVAAREGIDMVVWDFCTGGLQDKYFINSQPQYHPTIETWGSGGRKVTFRSGAWVKIQHHGSVYASINVGAPGTDFKLAKGLCGIWNGQRYDFGFRHNQMRRSSQFDIEYSFSANRGKSIKTKKVGVVRPWSMERAICPKVQPASCKHGGAKARQPMCTCRPGQAMNDHRGHKLEVVRFHDTTYPNNMVFSDYDNGKGYRQQKSMFDWNNEEVVASCQANPSTGLCTAGDTTDFKKALCEHTPVGNKGFELHHASTEGEADNGGGRDAEENGDDLGKEFDIDWSKQLKKFSQMKKEFTNFDEMRNLAGRICAKLFNENEQVKTCLAEGVFDGFDETKDKATIAADMKQEAIESCKGDIMSWTKIQTLKDKGIDDKDIPTPNSCCPDDTWTNCESATAEGAQYNTKRPQDIPADAAVHKECFVDVNENFAKISLYDFEEACAEACAGNDKCFPDGKLTKELKTVCEDDCSGNGVCHGPEKGCECKEGFWPNGKGFGGVGDLDANGNAVGDGNCATDTTKPAEVVGLSPHKCSVTTMPGCGDEIHVNGENIFESEDKKNIVCRFTANGQPGKWYVETPADFEAVDRVICKLPTEAELVASSTKANGGKNRRNIYELSRFVTDKLDFKMDVTLSTDGGKTWSATSAPFTWYDGQCRKCTYETCVPLEHTCNIDGKCYHHDAKNPKNPCQSCQAKDGDKESQTSWTFQYLDRNGATVPGCAPVFSSNTACDFGNEECEGNKNHFEISFQETPKDEPRTQKYAITKASNHLTKDDPKRKGATMYKYTITSVSPKLTDKQEITIDQETGVITVKGEFDHESKDKKCEQMDNKDLDMNLQMNTQWTFNIMVEDLASERFIAEDAKNHYAYSEAHVIMDVTNIDEPPVFDNAVINVNIQENDDKWSSKSLTKETEKWTATDPDCVDGRKEAVDYVLKNGKDTFRIVPAKEGEASPTLEILPGKGLNFETTPKFELHIGAEGRNNQQHSKKDLKMIFTVEDVNEKPTMIRLSPQDIDLETGEDVRVGFFTTVDEDTKPDYLGHTYDAAGGDGMADFKVAVCGGKPCLKTNRKIMGQEGAVALDITSCDQGQLCRTQPVYIRLNKPNKRPDTPTVQVLNPQYASSGIPENIGARKNGLDYAMLTTKDDQCDTCVEWSVKCTDPNCDANVFYVGDDNILKVRGELLNYETTTSYTVQVCATDFGNPPLTSDPCRDIIVKVMDEPDYGYENTHKLQTVKENSKDAFFELKAKQPVVGTPVEFSFENTEELPFTIDTADRTCEGKGNLAKCTQKVRLTRALDFETESSFTLKVKYDNDEEVPLQTVILLVLDQNEAPSPLSFTPTIRYAGQLSGNVGGVVVGEVKTILMDPPCKQNGVEVAFRILEGEEDRNCKAEIDAYTFTTTKAGIEVDNTGKIKTSKNFEELGLSAWKKGEITVPVTVTDASFEPKTAESTTEFKLSLEDPSVCVCISNVAEKSGSGANEFGCDEDYTVCKTDSVYVTDGFTGELHLDLSIPIEKPDQANKFEWSNKAQVTADWNSKMGGAFPFELKQNRKSQGKQDSRRASIEVTSAISFSDFNRVYPDGLELEMTATVKDTDCDGTNVYFANKHRTCEVSGKVKILAQDQRNYELYVLVDYESADNLQAAVVEKLGKNVEVEAHNNMVPLPGTISSSVSRRDASNPTILAISGFMNALELADASGKKPACDKIAAISGLSIIEDSCTPAFGYEQNPRGYATCDDETLSGDKEKQCRVDDWNSRDDNAKSIIIPGFESLGDKVIMSMIRSFLGEFKIEGERKNVWEQLKLASINEDEGAQAFVLGWMFTAYPSMDKMRGTFIPEECNEDRSQCGECNINKCTCTKGACDDSFLKELDEKRQNKIEENQRKQGDTSRSSASAASDEDNSYVAPVVVVCVIVVLAVGALFYMKQQREYQLQRELQDNLKGERYGDENYEALDEELVRGKYNKAHPWYRPSMSRQDATDHLFGLSEGCFLVREATRFDGLILGVKTRNDVIHIKIHTTSDDCLQLEDLKSNDEKTYIAAQTKQPKFGDCVMLVNYYAEPHEGVPFVLKHGNDSYDNSRLLYGQTQETPYVPAKRFPTSPGAPPVPPKESGEIGNPLYDSVEETQQVYNTRSVFNETYAAGVEQTLQYDDLPSNGAKSAPVYDDGSAAYTVLDSQLGSEASYGVAGGEEPTYDDGSVGRTSAL